MRRLPSKNILFVIIISLPILFLSCEDKSDSIIDSLGNSPSISNPILSISTINTDTINVGVERRSDDILTINCKVFAKVRHLDGQNYIGEVRYSMINPLIEIISEGNLHDDGIMPDQIANDSIFSGNVNFQIQRVIVGTCYVNLWSNSTDGYQSNMISLPIKIERLNHAPIISNLLAYDTLARNSVLKITLQVSDPDGLSDIYSVGYLSRKPDGNMANNGNPIPMFDDGDLDYPSGDALANNGIFTYTINVPSDAMLGAYNYTFFALDRSHVSSDSIFHTMVIK
jgi:hypothetical protein